MSNVIASAIFCARNTKKAENGDWGRVPVAVGQARNIVDSVLSYDNAIGRGTQHFVNGLNTAAESEKVLRGLGKTVNFFAKNINPLICVTSGVKVMTAEDKHSTLIQETAALSAMFAGEAWMKDNLSKVAEIKGIDKIAEKVMAFSKTFKGGGVIPAAIKGTAFVIGSCTAYNMGSKFGHLLTDKKPAEEAQTT